MAFNLGPGVSRVLSPEGTEYLEVIWQEGRPPLDSELNLLQALAAGTSRRIVLRGTPSGWIDNETNTSQSFITSPSWSNWFKYGKQKTGEQQAFQWAVVNGWLIPVTGTLTGTPPGSPDNTDTWNVIALGPPPSNAGDFRIDFAYLEVWLARIPPNPSTLNKPAPNAVYRYGNVLGGYSYIADDLIDPNIGEETTERVQVQYSIRIGQGLVGLTSNPDGFDPTVVFGQGAASAATTYTFANMRQTLNDAGLWRAGDGSSTAQTALGTVDGYTYAIPIAAVFRRNSVTWLGDPSPNLNGGFNRNPLAVNSSGILTFTAVPTLAADLAGISSALTATIVGAVGLPTPLAPSAPVLVQCGDELMTYSLISGTTMTLTARGVNGSRVDLHRAGTPITILSGRPDGIFSDQIVKTDILDLRHSVNPNGFDYDALLQSNFDKLVKGQLRANWKRTGAGPQGPFCLYQDKLTALSGGVALGVSRLDGTDNIRTIFSDAAAVQTVNFIVLPSGSGGAGPVSVSWSLDLTVNANIQTTGSQFNPGDQLQIPILQFKAGLPGGDADQVRFLQDGLQNAVEIRVDGQDSPLASSTYTVTGSVNSVNLTPFDDLIITFNSNFPVATSSQLWITVRVQYGPGRGVARRPDSFHQAAFLNPSGSMLVRPTGVPQQYLPMHTSWAPMWSQFRQIEFKGALPAATESYADLGSKTITLTPFRQLQWPAQIQPIDGTAANVSTSAAVVTSTSGVSFGNTSFTDSASTFTTFIAALQSLPWTGTPAYAIQVTNGIQSGRFTLVSFNPTVTPSGTFSVVSPSPTVATSASQVGTLNPGALIIFASQPSVTYTILAVTSGNITLTVPYSGTTNPTTTGSSPASVVVDRNIAASTGLHYTITAAQGLMPLLASDGVTPKWTTTDPLGLFSGTTSNGSLANHASSKNIYITLPRKNVPGWGEYHVPILWADSPPFSEGINYMSLSTKQSGPPPYANSDQNYVSYASGIDTFSTFSTFNNNPIPSPAVYNSAWIDSGSGKSVAGIQQYTDTRNLGRQGLQLPPFYGIARLFAVYEAGDYYTNGSSYNSTTRAFVSGKATNLLRQNVQGPTFWIEIDADGDSTFILNANVIDISRSPLNPISSFAAGNYVIEANVFGFDRNSFNTADEVRIVLNRSRSTAGPPYQANDPSVRSNNLNNGASNIIAGPVGVLQGPLTGADSTVLTYSRTPYQGDPWGSQTNYIDIGQFVGPLTSSTAYQLATTTLNQSALTRPNQKLLEVLASMPFITTLGTGRISGDIDTIPDYNLRVVGYENPASYPPTSPVEARPVTLASDFTGLSNVPSVGTDLLGCTERLPLGALFRDKDFRGEPFNSYFAPQSSTFKYPGNRGEGFLGGLAVSSTLEQTEVIVDGASLATGAPGELVVHVDGEQANYSLLVNFRVFRGGSAFAASGRYPGGELMTSTDEIVSLNGHANVLSGMAYLVRNTVTTVGASQVSAGDELMMLVVTTVQRLTNTSPANAAVIIGTNGSLEGYSAADLYRIEGHPLLVDNVRSDTNPSTIPLTPVAFTGT